MPYTLTQVINRVSTVLHDTSTAIWGTAAIGQAIDDGLVEIAMYSPRVVLATVTPVSGTPDLDISGTAYADLLYGYSKDSIDEVEFQVDKEPKRFRNFSVHHQKITMDISFEPDGTDSARLYLKKAHVLGGAGTSSLSPEMERLLIDLVAAKLAKNVSIDAIGEITIGGAQTFNQYITWGRERLDEVKKELRRLAPSNISVEYPRVV